MKKKQIKSKADKRKEIVKMRAEISEIKNRKSLEKVNEGKISFFEKINKIDKTLAKVTKKKGENTNYNIRSEGG